MFARLLILILLSVEWVAPAFAASTIDTSQPVQGVPFNAAPIRDNFGAAAADINAIESLNAGSSAPANPGLGTLWLNTSTTTYSLNIYVPASHSWLPIARIDSAGGIWMPPIGGGTLPSIVSAATTNLGSVPQAALNITGSQSIASFGSSTPAGQLKFLVFTGAPTLIYNSTFMILPGNANLSLSAGQSLVALSLGGGAWRVGFGSATACGIATTLVNGCVHPDGTTITINGAGLIAATGAGVGTVTSVTFTGDGTVLSSTPSTPVTTTGTLVAALNPQAIKRVLAGPTSGSPAAPTFRQLTCADLSDAAAGCSSAAGITQLTGDLTAGPGSGSQPSTLANTAVTPGSFVAPTVTVDSKGRITAATATTCNNSPFIAFTNCAQTYTASQRGTVQTVAISTATFTPNFDTAQNFSMTLVHASCPCTLANPSTTLVAGQSGMIEIVQSSTGSDTIGTWGSEFIAAGGTSTITLSTAANAKDRIPYYIPDTTHIMLGAPILNAAH